jgi:hypothetical protein
MATDTKNKKFSCRRRTVKRDESEQIEISPYIKSVMEGAPPRYLDDEIEAINMAKKLGWRPKPGEGSPAYRPGSYMEYLHNHPEEVDRILREHGIDPDEINKILEQGGGILPGWNGKKNKRNQT